MAVTFRGLSEQYDSQWLGANMLSTCEGQARNTCNITDRCTLDTYKGLHAIRMTCHSPLPTLASDQVTNHTVSTEADPRYPCMRYQGGENLCMSRADINAVISLYSLTIQAAKLGQV